MEHELNELDYNRSQILAHQDVQAFIEDRQIGPEDYSVIESLAKYSKSDLIAFHNYFLNLKERTAEGLATDIRKYEADLERNPHDSQIRDRKEISEYYLELCEKYGWFTANHLNRVLERIDLN